jgi:hypothetical protein
LLVGRVGGKMFEAPPLCMPILQLKNKKPKTTTSASNVLYTDVNSQLDMATLNSTNGILGHHREGSILILFYLVSFCLPQEPSQHLFL